MFDRFRKRVFEILEFPIGGSALSRFIDLFIMSIIVLNVVAIIIGTVPEIRHAWRFELVAFELFSIIVFTVEYVFRLWTCTTDPRYARPILGRLRYAATPMAIIDLLSFVPFYLPFLGMDLRIMRSLRLFRLVRVLKLVRYVKSFSLIGEAVRDKRSELVMTLALCVLLLIFSSTLMYFVEHRAQPEKFSSIPATMWWSMVTLTTVGYGDVYPVTGLGRFLGAIVAMIGIGMFALPTAILGSAFMEATRREREKDKPAVCPHCGKPLAP